MSEDVPLLIYIIHKDKRAGWAVPHMFLSLKWSHFVEEIQ